MVSMKDREDGFERKYVFDEELQFKAAARRNRLLGLWVAEKLGMVGSQADEYAKTVIHADFHEAGDEDVFQKIKADLQAGGSSLGDQDIRRVMDELLAKAKEQLREQS